MNSAAAAEATAVCPPATVFPAVAAGTGTMRAVDGELTALIKHSSVH